MAAKKKKKPGRPRGRPVSLQTRERHAGWYAQRLSGMTVTAIAEAAEVTPSAISQAIQRRYNELGREDAEQLLQLDLERLDMLWRENLPRDRAVEKITVNSAGVDVTEECVDVETWDAKRIETALKIIACRHRLLVTGQPAAQEGAATQLTVIQIMSDPGFVDFMKNGPGKVIEVQP